MTIPTIPNVVVTEDEARRKQDEVGKTQASKARLIWSCLELLGGSASRFQGIADVFIGQGHDVQADESHSCGPNG